MIQPTSRHPRSRGATLALAFAVLALAIVPALALAAVGDFGQPASSPEASGKTPQSVAAGNFNGDPHTDLAVANKDVPSVSIHLGDGTGNFTPAGTSPEAPGGAPWRVIAANLNGDAHTDLAVALHEDKVAILLGDGTGNFTTAGTSPETVGSSPRNLVAADLDGDTDLDLAVANFATPSVTILLNDGTGNFTAAGSEAVGSPASENLASIVAGNFDGGDGIDLAVGDEFSNKVRILLNDGDEDGDFTEAATSPETGIDGSALTGGNFNGDAHTDLAVATGEVGNVVILLGAGNGDFAPAGTSPEAAPGVARSIVAADLDGAGGTDLAVTGGSSPGFVAILLGAGNGDFAPAPSSPESAGAFPVWVTAANLDSDADTDLAVTNLLSDNFTVLLNDFTAGGGPTDPGPTDSGGRDTGTPTGSTPPLLKKETPAPQRKCPKGKVPKKGKCVVKKCPKGKARKKGKCVKKAKKGQGRSRPRG